MNDIEISHSIKLKKINTILKRYNFNNLDIENYGKYKAKIKLIENNKKGKLILVTSINPTPYGEGKTTSVIGLVDALNRLGYSSIAVLREPSMGPVFGVKGGATGGGYSQVVPMEDINLHFNGDIHAITSANNLICAVVDNHIYQGNFLDIEKITFNRCLDVNDRALRRVFINNKEYHFDITAASEIMAILCLAKDFKDLKRRISNIIVGFNSKKLPIYVKDLGCTDAVSMLLKDAIYPNAIQTLEGNLAIIHGGPFANIAQGTSSKISINLALSKCDYTVTEAGFGSDLGAEKFMDIMDLKPNVIVIAITIRALKYHGNNDIKSGLSNLEVHIENMLKYSKNILIALNRFATDTIDEINIVKEYVLNKKILFTINDAYLKGSKGCISFANEVINLSNNKCDVKKLYNNELKMQNKIDILCKEIYHAKNVSYSNIALEHIKLLEELNLYKMPICVAKTQYSISHKKELLGYPTNYEIEVTDVKVCNGAGFIVVYMGNIVTMPGLAKNSNYLNMKINDNLEIEGLM